jgi:hypothetical protein
VISSVELVVAIGQSNMSGRGLPVPAGELDAHLLQFARVGPAAGALSPAADPLAMPDDPAGVGPALHFARELRADRPDSIVIVVPAAVGGTALSTDEPLGWRWGVRGNLADLAVQQTLAGLAAAGAAFPDAPVRIAAILWLQGESDAIAGTSGEVYRGDLERFITGFRSALDAPEVPFVIGQMAVEGMDMGTHADIDRAQSSLARALPGVAFSLAPRRRHRGDRVHFTAAGQRAIASRMYRAYQAAS